MRRRLQAVKASAGWLAPHYYIITAAAAATAEFYQNRNKLRRLPYEYANLQTHTHTHTFAKHSKSSRRPRPTLTAIKPHSQSSPITLTRILNTQNLSLPVTQDLFFFIHLRTLSPQISMFYALCFAKNYVYMYYVCTQNLKSSVQSFKSRDQKYMTSALSYYPPLLGFLLVGIYAVPVFSQQPITFNEDCSDPNLKVCFLVIYFQGLVLNLFDLNNITFPIYKHRFRKSYVLSNEVGKMLKFSKVNANIVLVP